VSSSPVLELKVDTILPNPTALLHPVHQAIQAVVLLSPLSFPIPRINHSTWIPKTLLVRLYPPSVPTKVSLQPKYHDPPTPIHLILTRSTFAICSLRRLDDLLSIRTWREKGTGGRLRDNPWWMILFSMLCVLVGPIGD
jgi:hypothetical protein